MKISRKDTLKRRPKSLLGQQKIANKKFHFYLISLLLGLVIIVLSCSAFMILRAYKFNRNLLTNIDVLPNSSIGSKDFETIGRKFQSLVTKQESIQTNFNLASAVVFKDITNTSHVAVAFFSPLFELSNQKGSRQYISELGHVYSLDPSLTYSPDYLTLHENLPILIGIDQEQVTGGQFPVFRETVEIYQALTKMHITIASLKIDKYRGIQANSPGLPNTIYFGRPPFTNKLEKLSKTLDFLKKQNKKAIIIELDYDGKTLIREHANA
jgi:hypothetical protein